MPVRMRQVIRIRLQEEDTMVIQEDSAVVAEGEDGATDTTQQVYRDGQEQPEDCRIG